MSTTIKCKYCGREMEITEALVKNIEEKIRHELSEKANIEITDLKKALAEKEEKVEELREQELKLREEKRKIEEREKDLKLEVERRIDEEKKKIEEAVLTQASHDHHLKDLEKDKKINDLMLALEEATRKAQQGSQQLQGEILELDLEETLRTVFPNDEIEPVGKGVKGADVRQIVKSPKGFTCGVILWESKRTKDWKDEWLTKLKDDLRREKANIPVIVTSAMPKDITNGMGLKDGVWVMSNTLALPLATLLRKNLLDIAYQKAVTTKTGEKAELLYDYITGHEFRQQVEALVEVYKEMNDQIGRERAAFEKSWKAREAQIKRVLISVTNIYGSAQGLAGSSMPQIKGLELMELGEGK